MSDHRDTPGASAPIDPAIAALFEARADGADLRRVYDAVPTTDAAPSDAQRRAAWDRLSARLHDRARTPYTDEVKPPLELVRGAGALEATASIAHNGDEAAIAAAVAPRRAERGRALRRTRWLAAAASLVVAAGSGWVWGNAPVVYAVPTGASPQQVVLADGSSAWIAAGSQLSVVRRFAWPDPLAPRERRVQLDGEAYFEVQRDGRRFVVGAGDLRVQVLGTRFSVRSAQGAVPARVEVSEGRVAVQVAGDRDELAAGEAATVRDGRLRRRSVMTERVATWRTGGLAALDEPLAAVVAELERRFAVSIAVDEAVDLSPTVSLFYADMPAVDVVLADLCTAQGLGFTKTSRGYRIVAP